MTIDICGSAQATGRNMIDSFSGQWAKVKNLGIGKALAATLATHINSVSVGMCQGYSAILIPQLDDDPSSVFKVTDDDKSWIAGLGVITNLVGAIMSGLLMEWLGRKRTVQMVSLPFLLGWVTIALSNNLFILCIGRAITGVAIGMGAACYVYVAEISLPEHRGFLSAFGPIFVSLGVLIVYSLGYVFHWKVASAVCAVFAVLSALVISLIPESPSWLLARGREKKARKAIVWLRGDNDQAAQELADLSSAKAEQNDDSRGQAQWKQFLRPVVWKPFLVLTVFFMFQEGTGLYVILYFSVEFFKKAGSTMDNYVLGIIVATVRLVMSVVGTICIKRYSRRALACVSAVGMAVSMGIGGVHEYLYDGIEPFSLRPLPWLPQLCIIANVSLSMLGMLQLPWVMIGELFPTAVRGFMGGVVSSLAYFFIFMTIYTYPKATAAKVEMHIIMWSFAAISICTVGFVLLFLPETQRKTLIEIEEAFKGKKKCKKAREAEEIP